MDKKQAIKIVRETFEAPFDKGRFTNFVRNLLNEPDLSAGFGPRSGNYIPDSFKGYIEQYERLGAYEDSEGKRIDILIVYLKKKVSIERARSMQRNFVAGYLQGKYGSSSDKDAALVAFVAPGGDDWRFSLVKLEVRLEAGNEGKIKVKDEFTPAKRWSFLVGSHEKSHTAQTQFVPIMQDTEENPTLAQLEEAFNIEKVTKEFFLKYRELFIRTKEELDKVLRKDPKVREEFERKGIDTVNLAKKLLGQIVFLYYLQKKGWFGVPRDAAWGEGSRNFLRELFEKRHGDYRNFFNDILEPLFYEALRIDRGHDDHYYSRFDCKIPFLNGGLFDPMGNYDWVKTDILLPNDLFSNRKAGQGDPAPTAMGDEGDGILDIFDRYNFTVKEDEPFEKEVAIDPELLGKAYEKFNAIRPDNYEEYRKALKSGRKGDESKFNKQYGVYYTPREIVHYMCQQSLINYLYSELNPRVAHQSLGSEALDMFGNAVRTGQLDLEAERPLEEFPKEDIAFLIQHSERFRENEERVDAAGRETDTYSYRMPESIRKNASLLDGKLASIKVCDPAVGSGAFPVGMMNEIVKARSVLNTYLRPDGSSGKSDGNTSSSTRTSKSAEGSVRPVRSAYDFKRDCIENSLYGVDIDAGAVEIAKLRLWLSLVVDEDDPQNIKPLPNLDYKIVCGNSLIGVEKNLFNVNLFSKIESIKPLFFNATSPGKKQEYKKKIDALIDQITNGRVLFDFETYFSEVFHEKHGFDIVIGNPPYVRLQSMVASDTKQAKYLKDIYRSARVGNYDLYVVFVERGLSLTNPHGYLSYILPNKFFKAQYGTELRKLIAEGRHLSQIVYFGSLQIFEEATTYTCLLFLDRAGKERFLYRNVESWANWIRNQESITTTFENSTLSSAEWNFSTGEITPLFEKLMKMPTKLGDITERVFQGIIPGADKVYTVEVVKKGQQISTCYSYALDNTFQIESSILKQIVSGAEVKPYYLSETKTRVIYPYQGVGDESRLIDSKTLKKSFPLAYKYFSDARGILDKRDGGSAKGDNWYRYIRTQNIGLQPLSKLAVPRLVSKLCCGYDEKGTYCLDNVDVGGILLSAKVSMSPLYILGLLNSKLLDVIFKIQSVPFRGSYFSANRQYIVNLPIKSIDFSNQKEKKLHENLVGIVERVLAAKRANPAADTSELERQIDELVYQLYGLTPEEIAVVEGKDKDA